MKTIVLNTGTTMPVIGFGTWQLSSAEARRSVDEALRVGYRLIDTARIYMNERAVGEAIQASGVPRNEIFVSTKLWNYSQGYPRAKRAFQGSLRRLGVDSIDLYLIHWPRRAKRLASWRALEELYHEGRAKAVGVSNYTIRHLKELQASSSLVPAVNQVEFHPFLYDDQRELLDYCRAKSIVVEAYSPLAHGHRLDDPILTDIAKNYNKSVPQIMLRWAVQHGTIPLPKSTNSTRIKENFDIFDFELSQREMTRINGLSDGLRTCWNPENID